MPRPRKVALNKSAKRVRYKLGIPEIVQTLSCGECGKRLKLVSTQKPYLILGYGCYNIDDHKTGKIYLWIMKDVEMVGSTNQIRT